MLVEFTVSNYRSFREPQTLSMEATSLKSAPERKTLDAEVVFTKAKLKLLSSAAIYGANASGKSNFVRAWGFFREQIIDSARESQAGDEIEVEPFAFSTETQEKPSFFEVVFIVAQKRYRYGFEANSKEVTKEWLIRYGVKPTELFSREGDQVKINEKSFQEGRGLKARMRGNALFLSVVAQFNGKIAVSIIRWINEAVVVSGLEDSEYRSATMNLMKDPVFHQKIVEFIRNLDVNIQDVAVVQRERLLLQSSLFNEEAQTTPRRRTYSTIETAHATYNALNEQEGTITFNIREESAGTQKMIYFTGLLLLTLQNGDVLFVDELDARLHPLMTCEIIKLFNNKTTNPHGAQLVFTTHDTNLLANDMFRRDQIWFVEKDDFQASYLYSLAEFVDEDGNKARNDENLERNYIRGRFGAIPFIGDLKQVVGGAIEVAEENS